MVGGSVIEKTCEMFVCLYNIFEEVCASVAADID